MKKIITTLVLSLTMVSMFTGCGKKEEPVAPEEPNAPEQPANPNTPEQPATPDQPAPPPTY